MENLSDFCWKLIDYVGKNQNEVIRCSDEVSADRMNQCESCDSFDKRRKECLECGCFVPAKVLVVFESCPINKWGPDKDTWDKKFPEIKEELDNPSESL